MKKTFCILLTILTLISCSSNTDDTPYYSLTNSIDSQFLPTAYSQVGKVFKLRNGYGNEVSFKVVHYKMTKLSNGFYPYYYFDALNVKLDIIGSGYAGKHVTLDITKNKDNEMVIKVYFSGLVRTLVSPFNNLEQLSFNNMSFDKAYTMNIDWFFFVTSIDKRLHKMIYDFEKGIIAFDDVNDSKNSYRLVAN